VRAETEDGLVGWGEISDGWGCEYARVASTIVEEALARFVIGEDPQRVELLVKRMRAWLRRRQGTTWLISQAISGVEIALWDLAARADDQPVHRLLGTRLFESVPIYASGNFLSQGDAEVHASFFASALAHGVRAVKVRLGSNWESELDVLTELCKRLGTGVSVAIDGNEAFSAKTAGRIAQRLGDIGIAFFEEPVPRTDPQALAWLVGRSPVPIAYGEHVHGLEGFRALGEGRLADIWQPDATVCGGLVEARNIATLAASRGVAISPHSATTPLGLAANLHASASAASLTVLEYSAGSNARLAAFFEGGDCLAPDAIRDGGLRLPSGPGLGLVPRLDDLRRAFPYQPPWPIREFPSLYTGQV
jgi:D-galactarolactone cycloisomerase